MSSRIGIDVLAKQISACRICVEAPLKTALPHMPRPVVVLSSTARICIAGQAPGVRVHASGRPFTDPSGDRLRQWMGIENDVFYDAASIAIVPMGFCFPGLDAKGGDRPPRMECRKRWHDEVFQAMPQIQVVLAIGQYAQAYHLGALRGANLTQTVGNWRCYLERKSNGPQVLPLPHPSWRNNSWIKRNGWFDADYLPEIKKIIAFHLMK